MIAHFDDLTVLQNNALHKTKHRVAIKRETILGFHPDIFSWKQ